MRASQAQPYARRSLSIFSLFQFFHFGPPWQLPAACQTGPASPARPGLMSAGANPFSHFGSFHFRPESGKIKQCSGILFLHPCKPVNKLCKCDKSAKSLRVGRFVRIHSKMTNLTSWGDSSLTNLSGWRDSSLRGDMSRISRDMAFVT